MFRYISSMDGWIPGKFGMEIANAILFISYLDKICPTLTGSLGRASAFLYSEVRLYKGASQSTLPQLAASHSTGNISVGVKKASHSNTRGTDLTSSETILHSCDLSTSRSHATICRLDLS